jgi:hypothetical protein
MRGLSLIPLLLAVGLGCSGGAGGPSASLDCAYLASDNCWKTTASAATSCLPPASETGVLSSDNATCTYASGDVVTFDAPLVFPIPDAPNWRFTITTGTGQVCLHYEDTSAGLSLTVQGQAVTERISGPQGLTLSCPDGTSYTNPNSLELLDCGDDGGASFGGLPGDAWSSSNDAGVSFGLVGASTTSSDELALFNCQPASS